MSGTWEWSDCACAVHSAWRAALCTLTDRQTTALRLVANYSDLRARSAPRLVLFLSVSGTCVCLNNFEYNNHHGPYSKVLVMSTPQQRCPQGVLASTQYLGGIFRLMFEFLGGKERRFCINHMFEHLKIPKQSLKRI